MAAGIDFRIVHSCCVLSILHQRLGLILDRCLLYAWNGHNRKFNHEKDVKETIRFILLLIFGFIASIVYLHGVFEIAKVYLKSR
jgi:hypothetical protein